eukprot:5575875-Pyramimonas_sp.AAC.1
MKGVPNQGGGVSVSDGRNLLPCLHMCCPHGWREGAKVKRTNSLSNTNSSELPGMPCLLNWDDRSAGPELHLELAGEYPL